MDPVADVLSARVVRGELLDGGRGGPLRGLGLLLLLGTATAAPAGPVSAARRFLGRARRGRGVGGRGLQWLGGRRGSGRQRADAGLLELFGGGAADLGLVGDPQHHERDRQRRGDAEEDRQPARQEAALHVCTLHVQRPLTRPPHRQGVGPLLRRPEPDLLPRLQRRLHERRPAGLDLHIARPDLVRQLVPVVAAAHRRRQLRVAEVVHGQPRTSAETALHRGRHQFRPHLRERGDGEVPLRDRRRLRVFRRCDPHGVRVRPRGRVRRTRRGERQLHGSRRSRVQPQRLRLHDGPWRG